MKKNTIALAIALGCALIAAAGLRVDAQRGQGRGGPPPAARAAAPVDLTGYWVSVVTEDWRFRMVTPAKGDYVNVPLNAEGRRVADTWDPSKDGACEAYGAAGLMRMPGRLHITWEDDNTLKIETDAGQQTRLLHFGPSTGSGPSRAESRDGAVRPAGGERTLQGYSVAEWGGRGGGFGGGGFGGFGGNVAAPGGAAPPAAAPAAGRAGAPPPAGRAAPPPAAAAAPPAAPGGRGPAAPARWGPLKVITTGLRSGWLQKNGVPYSENTTLTEHFIRFADEGDEWFTVVTIVEDPTYLTQSFITSTNFKREADGARFKPVACKAN